MVNEARRRGEGAFEQMIYRYPEAQYKQYLTTGTCLVAFGVIMLILFSVKLFIRQPVIHYLLFIIGFLSIFPTGLTQFIRGFKHREIGYELDYSGFNIVHPEGIKTNVRWDDIKGIDETSTSIKFMTPRGQEEIYKNLEKFEEFYEIFKKYTKRDLKKTADSPRATPVSPKSSLKETKAAEGSSPPQKESKSPAEKESTPTKKGDDARDRMLKEIFASPSAAERTAGKESRPENRKPADSPRETGKTAAVQKETVKPEIAKTAATQKETVKPEIAKTAATQKETVKPEIAKTAATQKETVKPEIAKTAATQKETVKPEILKPDGLKWDAQKAISTPSSSEKSAPSTAESGAKDFEFAFGEVETSIPGGDLPDPGLRGTEAPSLNRTAPASKTEIIPPPQGGFELVFNDFTPSLPFEKEEKNTFATTQLSIKPKSDERESATAPIVPPLDTTEKEKAALSITPPPAVLPAVLPAVPPAAHPAKEERLSLGDLLGAPQSYRDAFPNQEKPPLSEHAQLPKVIQLLPERSPSPKVIPLPPKDQASSRSDGPKSSIPNPQDLMSSLKRIKEGLVPLPEAGAFIPPPAPPYSSRKSPPKEEHQETSFTLSLSATHSHRQSESKHTTSEEKTHTPGLNASEQAIKPPAGREDAPLRTQQTDRREETPHPVKKPAEREADRRSPADTGTPATREIVAANREQARAQSGIKAIPARNAEPATVETMMNDFVERLRALSQ
ncbi:MAG: hypothetical protein AB9903_29160 [Vulcanimicrobiota bacterium]